MGQNTYYITTAIDYVNAAPHLGHAYEKIATDVMARFQRLQGKEVFFLTGTDEHGTKVAKTAAEKGMDPKAYTDSIAEKFKEAWAFLNLSHNRFIRTTDPEHYEVVAHLWRVMQAKGDIYKASYTGLYCTGCETFLTERDLTEAGECRIHQRKPDEVREENYFFRLSSYKDKLKALIENGTFVKPDFRAQEVLHMLDDLQDISVSRPKTSVSWGIPVPDDPDQNIYVWIDALSNYVTGVGYRHDDALFSKFWPADCHVIGKDILRFHALYWPAMLMSAEIELPRQIFAHGFININESKISKSIGNVVSPFDLARRFDLQNADPIRYFLMTVTTFGQDGNFTEDDFKLKINANLANNLGNLVNRTLNMTQKYFDGKVPTLDGVDLSNLYTEDAGYLRALADEFNALPPGSEAKNQWKDGYQFPASGMRFLNAELRGNENYLDSKPFDQFVDDIRFKFDRFDFEFALYTTFSQLVNPVNLFIDAQAPWTLAKNNETDRLAVVLYSALERIRQVAVILYPVIPTLSRNIFEQLGYDIDGDVQTLKLNGQPIQWETIYDPLPFTQPIKLTGPLLPRLEDEIVGAAGKKK